MRRHSRAEGNVRLLRVGESVRHAIANILSRDMVQDPDLAGVAITVTEVEVSPDLRNATVYVLPLLGENQDLVVEALNRAAKFLRGKLSSMVHMKYLPQLQFQLDVSFDEADKVERVLASPAVKADTDAAEELHERPDSAEDL